MSSYESPAQEEETRRKESVRLSGITTTGNSTTTTNQPFLSRDEAGVYELNGLYTPNFSSTSGMRRCAQQT